MGFQEKACGNNEASGYGRVLDSGLDVDAVRTVSQGVKLYRERVHGSLLIITHSTRILEALTVDAAHVMENGVIVKNGGAELVDKINEKGFSAI